MDLCNLHCLFLFAGIIERIQIFKIWKAEQDFLSSRVFRVAGMMSEMAEWLLIERHHHVPVPFYTSSLCILPKWYVVMLTLKCFRTLCILLLYISCCDLLFAISMFLRFNHIRTCTFGSFIFTASYWSTFGLYIFFLFCFILLLNFHVLSFEGPGQEYV